MNALVRTFSDAPYSDASAECQTRVTEIIQHNDQVSMAALLLPMITQLSHRGRWLVLIAPPSSISREHLLNAGAVPERVWILQPDNNHSIETLACRALASGTCDTVISWHNHTLSEEELTALNQASATGGSQGIVIR